MALFESVMYSNVLEMDVEMTVILPQHTQKLVGTSSQGNVSDVPVLYLLHGMGGNHTAWMRKTSIERYAERYGLAVIMPSTDLAWYTDTTYDMKYWTFVSEELPQLCQAFFPQLTKQREKTYAAGLSMGGYGALKLGLRQPERFAAVASLSGPLALGENNEALLDIRSAAYWEGIFGPLEAIRGSENDPLYLVDQLAASGKESPRLFIACGEQDYLFEANQAIVAKLEQTQLPYEFQSGPGEHNWVFWDEWIQRALAWMIEK